MTIAWIIGLLLSLLGIWLLKNSIRPAAISYGKLFRPKKPVLRMWLLILLLIGAMIPILNIMEGIIISIYYGIEISSGNLEFTNTENKIVKFLNKPIT